MKKKFTRERIRFHEKEKDTLVIQGWFENDADGKERFEAKLDGKELPVTIVTAGGVEVTKKYLRYKTNVMLEYFLMIPLGTNWQGAAALEVFHLEPTGEKTRICHMSRRALQKESRHLASWMETLQERPDGKLVLRGWYLGDCEAKIAVLRADGSVCPAECSLQPRMDILGEFPETGLEQTHGFELVFEKPAENHLRLALKMTDRSGQKKTALYLINRKKMLSGKEGIATVCKKSWLYFQRKGGKQFVKRVSDVMFGNDSISYERWRRKHAVTARELERQRKTKIEGNPKFSILVPLYRTPEKYLDEMIASVRKQTYPNWELILSDGSGENSPLTQKLKKWEQEDSRILVLHHEKALRIAENTNAARKKAEGDFLVFGDHDDLFAPDALFECASAIAQNPRVQFLYTDEDKTDQRGKRFFEPHFKSDYNPAMLESMNYICHMVAVRKELADRVGELDPGMDGAQDYDYVLRCCEQLEVSEICHIPKILYHWRCHSASTAENPESKRYAFEAGCRALQAHYERLKIRAEVFEGEYPGLYRTEFAIEGEPLISVLIPNKDHAEDLRKCIDSIEAKSDYKNLEYIIIENNSTQPETFAYYETLQRENPKAHVVTYQEEEGIFNYSKINNFGAEQAKGSYYLLLNNDTEIINADCIRQMLGYCQRQGVGITGAKLFYEDGTIQHAGVVLGFGGIAGHAFIGETGASNGYFSRAIIAQDYCAVTAACMMVKADVFREVGGMTPELRVAFNDIDFCMKVRKAGYRVVYQPQARLYHYESKSRGLENTQEKIERFNREMACFLSRWGEEVRKGDPFYNPNLTLDKANFSIKQEA